MAELSETETETVGPLRDPSRLGRSAAGQVIADRYEVRGPLGSGGNATVYRIFDREVRAEIALKLLHPVRDPEAALARLAREVRIARDVESPHLVRVYDLGRTGADLYLTMELLRGGSLRDLLKARPLSVPEVTDVAEAVLQGLVTLHAKGAVHRDVKPGNILFSEKGEARLSDFGLARYLESEEATLTAEGALLGTRGYLSPEQMAGREASSRSDLYAMGVVLFEMLAGSRPRDEASKPGGSLQVFEPAPDVRTIRQEVPRWLARVVARLLAVRAADRYPSAEEALRDLRAHRAPRRPRLRRRLVLSAGLLLVLPLVIVPRPLRFLHLAPNGPRGIEAIGKDGERLWKREDADPVFADRFALVRRGWNERPLLATILMPPGNFAVEAVSTLSLLDPDTGHLVKAVSLPNAAGNFPNDPPRFAPSMIAALDLDHDGSDEVLISYSHVPEAPSYTVLYTPKDGRARVVFFGYGGHRFEGATDLDRDGVPELLFGGINNGWNWVNALAAVKLNKWPTPEENWNAFAASPDIQMPESASLFWYAIVPRGHFENPHCLQIDEARKRLILRYASGKTWALDYDGFPPDEVGVLPPKEREAARQETYRHLREAERLRRVGALAEAWTEADAAMRSAATGREVWLGQYARRLQAKVLVNDGRVPEAEALFASLWAKAEDAPEVAYDAGVAFHLHGDLRRAADWYARGIGQGAASGAGKSKHEFLEGEVLALVEAKRYQAALQAIERFDSAFPGFAILSPLFRSYIHWRAGEGPGRETVVVGQNWTDLFRYWQLEFDFARGEKPDELLPRVERFLKEKPVTAAEALSLRAEVLARLGRVREAIADAESALERVRAEQSRSIIARAHADLIAERAHRLKTEFDRSAPAAP